ncbi:NHLP-related RiPP peptide [Lysobacter fragariae]
MQTIAMDTNRTSPALAARPRSAPIDPQVADRLLDRLASDDDFRALFMRSPGQALAQVGFVNATDSPSPEGCFWGIELASKQEIARAREEIRYMLTQGLSQTSPQLDASIAGAYHRK